MVFQLPGSWANSREASHETLARSLDTSPRDRRPRVADTWRGSDTAAGRQSCDRPSIWVPRLQNKPRPINKPVYTHVPPQEAASICSSQSVCTLKVRWAQLRRLGPCLCLLQLHMLWPPPPLSTSPTPLLSPHPFLSPPQPAWRWFGDRKLHVNPVW